MRIGEQFGGSSFQIPLWKYTIEVNRLYFNILFIIVSRLQDREVNRCIPNPYMELMLSSGISSLKLLLSCLM